jgi:3-methyladenine DNA glycosylase/8-oxoguanine DNA glycosylase
LKEEVLATLPDETVVEQLIQIKGIGRWSAEIALLRGLARPDAFPGGDLGVVKYVAQGREVSLHVGGIFVGHKLSLPF